jgi:hypothetical protein
LPDHRDVSDRLSCYIIFLTREFPSYSLTQFLK